MIFRTEIERNNNPLSISYDDKILMIGSCFTENIGNWLKDSLFDIDFNPSGIMYNPVSVADSLLNIINQRRFEDKELFYHNGVFNSFYYHSRFSNSDKIEMINNINNDIISQKERLEKTDILFVTFGTAWVYSLNKNAADYINTFIRKDSATDEQIVGNCHKLSDKLFTRRRLDISEITTLWSEIISKLRVINKDMKIIFTVSPIRHIKDTLHGNQLSKAVLQLAIEELCCKNNNVSYFPAYEILIDDLRDYRFYTPDMVHPSESAIEYIKEKFSEYYFNKETVSLHKECQKISRALNHRPKNENSYEYLVFLTQNINKLESLIQKYDYFSFQKPLKQFLRIKQNIKT